LIATFWSQRVASVAQFALLGLAVPVVFAAAGQKCQTAQSHSDYRLAEACNYPGCRCKNMALGWDSCKGDNLNTCDCGKYEYWGCGSNGDDDASERSLGQKDICTFGLTDSRCKDKPNGYAIDKTGWCHNGRRDTQCPCPMFSNVSATSSDGCTDNSDMSTVVVAIIAATLILASTFLGISIWHWKWARRPSSDSSCQPHAIGSSSASEMSTVTIVSNLAPHPLTDDVKHISGDTLTGAGRRVSWTRSKPTNVEFERIHSETQAEKRKMREEMGEPSQCAKV